MSLVLRRPRNNPLAEHFIPLGGQLADRLGRRLSNVIGLSLLTFGLLPLALNGSADGVGRLLGLGHGAC